MLYPELNDFCIRLCDEMPVFRPRVDLFFFVLFCFLKEVWIYDEDEKNHLNPINELVSSKYYLSLCTCVSWILSQSRTVSSSFSHWLTQWGVPSFFYMSDLLCMHFYTGSAGIPRGEKKTVVLHAALTLKSALKEDNLRPDVVVGIQWSALSIQFTAANDLNENHLPRPFSPCVPLE